MAQNLKSNNVTLLDESSVQSITNKTIDGSLNTLINLPSSTPTGTVNTAAFFDAAGDLSSSTGFKYNELSGMLLNNFDVTSLTAGTYSDVIMNGKTIDVQGTLTNSLISGATITVQGATNSNSLFLGTGNVTNGVTNSIVSGNTTTFTQAIANSLILSNTLTPAGAGYTNSILAGTTYTMGATTNSIITGTAHTNPTAASVKLNSIIFGTTSAVRGVQNSLVGGASISCANVGAAGIGNSVLVGNTYSTGTVTNSFVGGTGHSGAATSNIINSVLVGLNNTRTSGTITRSFVSNLGSHTSQSISGAVTSGVFNSSAAIDESLVIISDGSTIAGAQESVVVGVNHTMSTQLINKSLVVGQGHSITVARAGYSLTGVWGDFTDTNRTLVFGIGASNVSRANGFAVGNDGLIEMPNGGHRIKTRVDASAAVAVNARTDYVVLCTNGGATVVNLPAGAIGMEYKIKAVGTTTLTLTPNGADTIDVAVVGAGVGVNIAFNGTAWYTF